MNFLNGDLLTNTHITQILIYYYVYTLGTLFFTAIT